MDNHKSIRKLAFNREISEACFSRFRSAWKNPKRDVQDLHSERGIVWAIRCRNFHGMLTEVCEEKELLKQICLKLKIARGELLRYNKSFTVSFVNLSLTSKN